MVEESANPPQGRAFAQSRQLVKNDSAPKKLHFSNRSEESEPHRPAAGRTPGKELPLQECYLARKLVILMSNRVDAALRDWCSGCRHGSIPGLSSFSHGGKDGENGKKRGLQTAEAKRGTDSAGKAGGLDRGLPKAAADQARRHHSNTSAA